MTVVQVEYTVPVSAFVDTETGEVKRVSVWVEGISKPEPGAMLEDYSGPVDDDTAARAHEIAETGSEWPAWGFG